MTSSTGKIMITIPILPNILRNKGNQKMKFGQLIEYNKWNIFITKSYTKCVAETSTRPVSKKSELSLPMDQKSEMLYILLLLYI